MTKRFYLSFCDPRKPKGTQFIGACIVEVSEADVYGAGKAMMLPMPQHLEEADWLAGAIRKAWQSGCNPGGEVMSVDITHAAPSKFPVGRLLSRTEMIALEDGPIVNAFTGAEWKP